MAFHINEFKNKATYNSFMLNHAELIPQIAFADEEGEVIIAKSSPIPPTPKYTISVVSGGNGTVDIDGSGTSKTVDEGTSVTVNATPNSAYQFDKWSDNGAQSHQVTVNSDTTLTATFKEIEPCEKCLTFTADGENKIYMDISRGGEYWAVNLEYSYDKKVWSNLPTSSPGITFGTTEHPAVYVRGNNPNGLTNMTSKGETVCQFVFENSELVDCSGNVMHLLSYTQDLTTIPNVTCFYGLFMNCTCLRTAPSLPATKLMDICYGEMFTRCTNLTSAPEIPNAQIATDAFYCMFSGCTNLNYVKCLICPTDGTTIKCCDNWLKNVSSSGRFYKNSMASWQTGENGIPTGWTVYNA